MAPDISARYQRAADLLDDVLGIRTPKGRHTPAHGVAMTDDPSRGSRGNRDEPGTSRPGAIARNTRSKVLLAVPQAAARTDRSVSVLR